jgi:hypothetical protein
VPCLLAAGLLAAPRFIIVLLVVFSDYIGRAFDNALFPILGFIFLPTTTLAWAFAQNRNGGVSGLYLVLVIIAVLLDLGFIGGGRSWFIRRDRS